MAQAPALSRDPERQTLPPPTSESRPALTLVALARDDIEPLIHRLALDRLRDLRDDGVSTAYMGRIYGVDRRLIEAAETELRSRISVARPRRD
ncbi:MAG TPA: hypothetical protein VFL93_12350 [Longimicrobiaceae bacterium]|nr:hypothetical protein [Longimicrobiaceae bacterium]